MNGVSDERMTILRMIESNKITVEQGSLLLGALGKQGEQAAPQAAEPAAETPSPASKPAGSGRRFRVLVTDSVTGKNKVSVNLPLSLVRWGLHTGKKFSGEMDGIDMDQLADLLESGEDGQFIEVIDEEDGEHVRVFIE
jgi:hypothetical protein